MNIFNSLGSNYNFGFVIKSLLATGSDKTKQKLIQLLEQKYGGEVALTYKGRQAIELGLKALNLPEGSVVAICGYTCFAVYQAVKNAGLGVEYLDLSSKRSLNFEAQTLAKAVTKNPKIKVVIIQNTLGYPCDIEGINKICKEKKLVLMEDLAHSVGTVYEKGQEAGSVGDMVALSFSQDKIVDGISGGAVIMSNTTNPSTSSGQVVKYVPMSNEAQDSDPPAGGQNDKQQETSLRGGLPTKQSLSILQELKDRFYPLFTYKVRLLYPFYLGKVVHAILRKIGWLSVPMNDQTSLAINDLPNWYAGLALDSLKKLNQNIEHRRMIARVYAGNLNEMILSKEVVETISRSTNLRFPIFVSMRQGLINELRQHGVYISDIWYDSPIAPKKYLSRTDYDVQCPNAEKVSETMVNLPTHINVSEKDAKDICSIINAWKDK